MNQLQLFQDKHGLKPDGVPGPITMGKMMEVFSISSKEHMAHYIGQLKHESQNFKRDVENLNYSAQGLANTWPHRYAVDPYAQVKTPNRLAKHLHRRPEAIANNCYSDRMGNGNEESGDGWKYRGRTGIMRTGKENYQALALKVCDPCIMEDPDLVNEKYYWESALLFFEQKKIWQHCDIVNREQIIIVTRIINGGIIGYKDRIEYVEEAYEWLCK